MMKSLAAADGTAFFSSKFAVSRLATVLAWKAMLLVDAVLVTIPLGQWLSALTCPALLAAPEQSSAKRRWWRGHYAAECEDL